MKTCQTCGATIISRDKCPVCGFPVCDTCGLCQCDIKIKTEKVESKL